MLILRLTDEVTRIINTCKEKYPQVIASSSSSPLSESNDILVGIDQSEADPQTRRLQELGCDLDLLGIDDPIVEPNPTQKMNESTNSKQAAIDDLQQLNNVFMQNQFGYQPTQSKPNNGPAPTLVDLANGTTNSAAPPQLPATPAVPPSVNQSQIQPLTGIQFNVTDFKPSKTSRQLCEENGIRTLLMRGENKIESRPEVTVLLVTIDSTCPKPIENLIFNAKVEKPYRIKCLQPSGNEFESFNPISSSSQRITQVLLMGGRPKSLQWSLQFDLDDETINKTGSMEF